MQLKTHPSMVPHCQKVLAGEYEIRNLRLPDNPVIVDVGANCGAFTAWALKNWPTATVYAYEPNPEAIKFFKMNFGENKNVMLYEAAVTNVENPVLRQGKNNIGEASIHDTGEQAGVGEIVARELPEDLPACHLLKIDAEGSELEILDGFDFGACVAVVLEYHSAEDCQKITEKLNGFGYIIEIQGGEHRGIIKAYESKAIKCDTSKVMFGIPVHYSPTTAFATSMIKLSKAFPGCDIRFLEGDSHPDRARNRIARDFLASDKDYLFFLDADLAFEPETIMDLYKRGKDIVCGFYAKKQPGPAAWVGNVLSDEEDQEGLVTMREAGTGCICIHRNVLQAMKEAWPEIEYFCDGDGKMEWAFFDACVMFDWERKMRRWLSEDWAFCNRARQLGFEIYADKKAILLHQGSCFFPLA
jgi:FkbM family methyltransferase